MSLPSRQRGTRGHLKCTFAKCRRSTLLTFYVFPRPKHPTYSSRYRRRRRRRRRRSRRRRRRRRVCFYCYTNRRHLRRRKISLFYLLRFALAFPHSGVSSRHFERHRACTLSAGALHHPPSVAALCTSCVASVRLRLEILPFSWHRQLLETASRAPPGFVRRFSLEAKTSVGASFLSPMFHLLCVLLYLYSFLLSLLLLRLPRHPRVSRLYYFYHLFQPREGEAILPLSLLLLLLLEPSFSFSARPLSARSLNSRFPSRASPVSSTRLISLSLDFSRPLRTVKVRTSSFAYSLSSRTTTKRMFFYPRKKTTTRQCRCFL